MAKEKEKAKDEQVVLCTACGGRKVIAHGTDEVPCAACGGKGTVKG